jgi:hypothetical protein
MDPHEGYETFERLATATERFLGSRRLRYLGANVGG